MPGQASANQAKTHIFRVDEDLPDLSLITVADLPVHDSRGTECAATQKLGGGRAVGLCLFCGIDPEEANFVVCAGVVFNHEGVAIADPNHLAV